MDNGTDRILIGEAEFRNKRTPFGIKIDDLRRHIYAVGLTGVGKTTFLETMALYHIQHNKGVGIIDPHGEFSDRLMDYIPKERIDDVVYINPSDTNYPLAFNVMESVDFEQRHLVASSLLSVFKKIWPDVWSARMEYILNNTFLALLEYPDSTLLGISRMLADKDYRKMIVSRLMDPVVKAFWTQEFARYHDRFQVEAIAPLQNKVGQFTANPLVRNIIGQKKTKLNLREIIDTRKILIVRLPVGLVGESNASLLGGLLVTKLQQAAMSRIDIPENQREDFCLVIDEFQNFATESFIKILSEARKYHLNLVIGHQYLDQIPEEILAAILGNVGTYVAFRIGPVDAEKLEPQFLPQINVHELVNLPNHYFYIKMMIDGVTSPPFLGTTLLPPPLPVQSYKEEIIKLSQLKYSTQKGFIEQEIQKWLEPVEPGKEEKLEQEPEVWEPVMLHEAVCSSCGKDIRLPFEPDPNRPVYCKKCLKKVKKPEAEKKPAKAKAKKPVSAKPKTEPKAEEKKSGLGEMLKKIISSQKPEKETDSLESQEQES
ncbi:MAG: CxxC-x17-CxxC domain-containing protein [Patescibacteria group bacterium]